MFTTISKYLVLRWLILPFLHITQFTAKHILLERHREFFLEDPAASSPVEIWGKLLLMLKIPERKWGYWNKYTFKVGEWTLTIFYDAKPEEKLREKLTCNSDAFSEVSRWEKNQVGYEIANHSHMKSFQSLEWSDEVGTNAFVFSVFLAARERRIYL